MTQTNAQPVHFFTDKPALNIALDTIKNNKQALIFNNSKPSAEKTAELISHLVSKHQLISIQNKESLSLLAQNILQSLSSPTKQCQRLASCIKKGIAFHHAGLTSIQRQLIENAFRQGQIKIISSTPTLAAGLDLPAFRVILKSLRRYSSRGLKFIPVLEYLQMSGRAGRPKFDSFGESITIAKTDAEKDKIFDRYILGEPEPIYSKLAVEPVLRTYLLSLIVSGFVSTQKQILDFFSRTFWAFQFHDLKKLEHQIVSLLELLEEWKFLISLGESSNSNRKTSKKALQNESVEEFVSADQFNSAQSSPHSLSAQVTYQPTPLGKRVAELYLDPLTAHQLVLALDHAKKLPPSELQPISFLQVLSNTLEMRPWLRIKTREYDDYQELLTKYQCYFLEPVPNMFDPDYDDFMNSFKTALFFLDWINEFSEEHLLERYSIRPGELHAKLNNADWLIFSLLELSKILQMKPLHLPLAKIRLRLKYGAKTELLPLLRIKNIGRARARKLYRNKIKNIRDLKKASTTTLSQVLGPKLAQNIKKQLAAN